MLLCGKYRNSQYIEIHVLTTHSVGAICVGSQHEEARIKHYAEKARVVNFETEFCK